MLNLCVYLIKKIDSYLEKYKFARRFEELKLEILHSITTPYNVSSDQLKIAFKHPYFVREPF